MQPEPAEPDIISSHEANVTIAMQPSKKARQSRSDKGTRRKSVAVSGEAAAEAAAKSKTRRRKPEQPQVSAQLIEVRRTSREPEEAADAEELGDAADDAADDALGADMPDLGADIDIGEGVVLDAGVGAATNSTPAAAEMRDDGNEKCEMSTSLPGLYPVVGDPKFNELITKKKEFYDTRYRNLDDKYETIEEYAQKMCDAPDFELAPHQLFIRNFMSAMTPYNSLLLYHGLGTGKTCSAITVAEEMRDYLTQMGLSKRIIVVASPNVQENFRLQLFDSRKLEQTADGMWNLRACTGNKYLREINPTNMQGMTKEFVISHVNAIITSAYKFVGYIQLGRMITKAITGFKTQNAAFSAVTTESSSGVPHTKDQQKRQIQRIRARFNNTLLIIDEVHNLRMTSDNKNDATKKTASLLMLVAKHAQNLRLLLLSGTPMFNSPREIVWLLNLMNINDNRSTIKESDVFYKDTDNILTLTDIDKTRSAYSYGKEILKCKSYGYISYIRGENPFTFPYRFYPAVHSPDRSFISKSLKYPRFQYDDAEIVNKLGFIDVYASPIGSIQEQLYQLCIYRMRQVPASTNPSPAAASASAAGAEGEIGIDADIAAADELPAKIGLRARRPLQALTIVFPCDIARAMADPGIVFVGEAGFDSVMTETLNPKTRTVSFAYAAASGEETTTAVPIFKPEHIGNYSHKISNICGHIEESRRGGSDAGSGSGGIVLVYTEYVKGGAIPLALALEEMGYGRYNQATWGRLLKNGPGTGGTGKNYIIVSGDPRISPDTKNDIIAATDKQNSDGSVVKVIIITKAGSEGLDFKNIRQVHIMDPWYNMNLLEQVIGRAVRTCSHRELIFDQRNVSIFMHGTLLLESPNVEAIDLCLYRYAEDKAVKIGNVSRILKKYAVDCNLNSEYNNMKLKVDRVTQILSNGMRVTHDLAPKLRSDLCDYQDDCNLSCGPPDVDMRSLTDADINTDTYDLSFLMMNSERIIQRVRNLFKERFFYTTADLFRHINIIVSYPESQIYVALDELLDNPHEVITDYYGRPGHLIRIDDYYLFQPLDIDNPNIGIRERAVPLDENLEYVEYAQNKADPIAVLGPGLSSGPGPGPAPATDVKAKGAKPVAAAAAAAPAAQPAAPAPSGSSLLLEDIYNRTTAALLFNPVPKRDIRKKESSAAAAAAAAASESAAAAAADEFKKFSTGNINKLLYAGFNRDILIDAALSHYLDVLSFEQSLTIINYIRPDRPRPPMPHPVIAAGPGAAANLMITRTEFDNRIYRYYTDKRRLIRHRSNGNVCAIVLNHKSIDSWSGADLIKYFRAAAAAARDDEDDAELDDAGAGTIKASSSKLFAFAVIGGSGASQWSVAKQSDNDVMVGAIYEYIANIKDGVFVYGAGSGLLSGSSSSYQHNIGFYESRDDASHVFKTLHIDPSAAKLKVTGRMCEQDSNKAMFIIPRLKSLLRLTMIDKDDAYIDAYINADTGADIAGAGSGAGAGPGADFNFVCSTNRGSMCVLTELILRYYDAVPPPLMEAQSPRWYLRPCEMQLLKRALA